MTDLLVDETSITPEAKLRFLQWAADRVFEGKPCRLKAAVWCYPCWQLQTCREHYENATLKDDN